MSAGPNPVLTIGHSTHPIEVFIARLMGHRVDVVADVRSAPYSRFTPHFNRETLAGELKAHGIRYLYLGRELGARSDDPSCYEDGRVQYARLERTSPFQEGIARVLRGASAYRVALMCAEKEPLECHRTLLVSRALARCGADVQHVLEDGRIEPHEASMERLLDLVGLSREDLFLSKSELLAEAIRRQEKRIAYVDEKLAEEARGESP